MKNPKNYVILLFLLTTVGGAMLAWHQYQELAELRAAALNRDDGSALRKRIGDLERSNRELSAQRASDADLAKAGEPNVRPEGRGDRGGRGGPGGPPGRGGNPMQQAAIRDLLNKPEIQAIMNQQQKLDLDLRYAALFRNLNLSSEQAGKLATLIAERQSTRQDVMTVARDQGIDPRTDQEAFRKLITDAQTDVNNSIKSLIGDDGYSQLQSYDQTIPQRNVVTELQQRLSNTNTPLTPAQAEQLVQILATGAPVRPAAQLAGVGGDVGFVRVFAGDPGGGGGLGGGGPGPAGDPGAILSIFGGGGRNGPTASITPTAISQAQTVLSQPQVSALQQLQQQQQAQQQLQQLVRTTLQQSMAPAQTPGDASGSAPAAGKGRRGGG